MQDVDAHNINLNQNNIQAHNKSKNNTTCENDGSLSNKNLLMARNPTLKSRVSYCDTCPKGGGSSKIMVFFKFYFWQIYVR